MSTVMRRAKISGATSAVCVAAWALLVVGNAGCPGHAPDTKPSGNATAQTNGHDHGHDHPTEGPHHGDLIELGNEEYHGELVHGKGDTVTVYILDGSAKKVFPIEAESVTINYTHDSQAHQRELAAAPDKDDPDGKSSRFQLQDEALAKFVDSHGATGRLVVNINGTQYSGKFECDHGGPHDHSEDDGHGHDHDDDHKHE